MPRLYFDKYKMNHNYFKNKYLVNSTRLPSHDYSADGFYFFTICIKNRKCFLGEVKRGIMGLSEIGCMVYKYWYALPRHYPNCILDEIIVMPNHLHAIIKIDNHLDQSRDGACPVSTRHSLSNIVGSLKSACTKHIHQSGHSNFSWQERFYDHIIKLDSESLDKIRWYIKYNPPFWDRDRNNPINIKL